MTITIDDIKRDLRVTHDDDDALLDVLLDAAIDEAVQYLDLDDLPTVADSSSSEKVAPSLYAAIFLLVRAKYDATTPDEISRLRQCAETLMAPYRVNLGA